MKTIKYLTIVLVLAIVFYGCEKKEDVKSSAKSITEFSISSVTGTINEADKTISLTMPYGTDITALEPTISISKAASILPASGIAQDFTNPVNYQVTAEDGSQQSYIVSVTVEQSTNNKILSFGFNDLVPAVAGNIDDVNKKVSLTVPRGTNLTNLVPTITISDNATISPASGNTTDFSNEVIYTITAQNGSKVKYTVTVSYEPNNENSITEFKFEAFTPSLVGVIDESAKTIIVTIPWDAEFDIDYQITSLSPTITVSEGATVNPSSGENANFNSDITFTVTAENGEIKDYTVKVVKENAPDATIDALAVTEYSIGDFITITGTNFTRDISVEIGSNTDYSIISDVTKTSFKIEITSYNFTLGDNPMKINIREQKIDIGSIKIVPPPPAITQLTTSTSDGNKILRIDGSNFIKGDNKVYFVKGSIEEPAYIKSEDGDYRIYVIIPPFIETGNYNIKVVSGSKTGTSTETVAVTMSTTTEPVITGVNKTTVANGETLEIYGKNFKNVGAGVVVGWMDGMAATKTITGSVISSEKIEVVIDRTKLNSDRVYEFYLQWFGTDYSENNFYNITITD